MSTDLQILGRIEWPQRPGIPTYPVPTERTLRQTCPICHGKTVVRRGFYPDSGGVGSAFEKCRSCHGRGIV